MSLWSKVRGTIETIFQLGIGGPQIKANAGVVEAKNAADSAYAVVRGAHPTGADNNQLTTQLYVDTIGRPMFVTEQFNGGDAIPANTGTAHYIVTTTTGVNASIGSVLYDDGSGAGNCDVLVASDGRLIVTKAALAGGTISFAADTMYLWDGDGSVWGPVTGAASASGAIKLIRYVIDNSAAQDSVTSFAAGAYVVKAQLKITTPYTAGTTIMIGRAAFGEYNIFMLITDNDPVGATANDAFVVDQETATTAGAVVRTSIAGAPAVGAGVVSIWYSVPNV